MAGEEETKEGNGIDLDQEWADAEGSSQGSTSPGLEPTIEIIPTPNGGKRVMIADPELVISEINYNNGASIVNPQFSEDLKKEVNDLELRLKAEQNKNAKLAQIESEDKRFKKWAYALDAYTDDFLKGNLTPEKAIICALNYIAKELNAQYIGLTLNPNLNQMGKYAGDYTGTDIFIEGDKSYSNERVKAIFDMFRNHLKKKGAKEFVPQFNGNEDDMLDIFTEPDKEREDAAEPENERTLNLTEKIKNFNVKLNLETHDVALMRNRDDFGEGYIAVKVEGSAKTIYLQPANYVVGALSVIGSFDPDDEKFFTGDVRKLLDTFIVKMLNLKVEGEEGKLNKETNASVGGIDFNESGKEFLKYHAGEELVSGENDKMVLVEREEEETKEKRPDWKFYKEGSYFEREDIYNKIKDGVILFGHGFLGDAVNEGIGGNPEDIRNRQYQNSVNFFKKHYKARQGIKATEKDAKKDSESAESLVKLVYGLFDQFGGEIAKHGLSGENADEDALRTASMFVAAFARAIKYMNIADGIRGIEKVREEDDIKEMTSFIENLLLRINGKFSYGASPEDREPLMSKDGTKVSYLGRIITSIAHQIDPNKVNDFVVDMLEQAIEYEARVTPSTSYGFGNIQPIDAALMEMYKGCIYKTINIDTQAEEKHIDQNKLRATKMIDLLVNPKGTDVYRTFKPVLDGMLKAA